jgi:hypothetical protein
LGESLKKRLDKRYKEDRVAVEEAEVEERVEIKSLDRDK